MGPVTVFQDNNTERTIWSRADSARHINRRHYWFQEIVDMGQSVEKYHGTQKTLRGFGDQDTKRSAVRKRRGVPLPDGTETIFYGHQTKPSLALNIRVTLPEFINVLYLRGVLQIPSRPGSSVHLLCTCVRLWGIQLNLPKILYFRCRHFC